jgi:hypothetical protein
MRKLRAVPYDTRVRLQHALGAATAASLRSLLRQSHRIWVVSRRGVRLLPIDRWRRDFLEYYWGSPGWTPDQLEDHANDTSWKPVHMQDRANNAGYWPDGSCTSALPLGHSATLVLESSVMRAGARAQGRLCRSPARSDGCS